MKIFTTAILVAIVLIISSSQSFAQVDSGSQPSGNLVYAPDGYIYGAYTKTTAAGTRPTTIYRYLPGATSIDPIYRMNDAIAEVHAVDANGLIFGTSLIYNSSGELVASTIFRVKNDGTGYAALRTSDVATEGIFYNAAILGEYTVSALRSGGGWWGNGYLVQLKKTGGTSGIGATHNIQYDSLRPTSLATFNPKSFPDGYQPEGIWVVSSHGGTFGKGSIVAQGFLSDELTPLVEFTGYGGGALDGEGPVNIAHDHDTDDDADIIAVTRGGGASNEGALFFIGADSSTYKLYDFAAPYGKPFGIPSVEFGEGKVFGLGGDFSTNTGFIYSYSRVTNTFNNVASFGPSSPVNGVTSIVVAPNGVIYGIASSTGSDSENGCFFAINQDGTNTQVIFKFADGYSRLLDPANYQEEASVTPTLRVFTGLNSPTNSVSNYRIEISENADFTGTVHVVNTPDGNGKIQPPGLKYSTKYYARVKTNLIDDFGLITSFTTHAPEKYSFVGNPLDGATNVALNGVKATANIVYGATLYTIEFNTSADFTGTSIVKTSAVPNQRTIVFDGLQPSTTYYTRAKTNYPSDWGPIRSFTTVGAAPPPEFIAETNELKVYPNPFERNFTIEPDDSGELNVSLIDLTGRELVKTQVTHQPVTLGDQLAPGIYLLRINTNGRTSVKRMVKK